MQRGEDTLAGRGDGGITNKLAQQRAQIAQVARTDR